ncbi:hypothetical protein PM082_007545 [Marasmius tenuissimus]|nr:hypothetical protein PM082_007545 [Marasmius tenuissimus]
MDLWILWTVRAHSVGLDEGRGLAIGGCKPHPTRIKGLPLKDERWSRAGKRRNAMTSLIAAGAGSGAKRTRTFEP